MILLIDNYDSFVYNLARYFRRVGQETVVVRNDAIDVAGIRRLDPDAIVLSPGPCSPTEAGCCLDVAEQLTDAYPILGVCLGHQALAAAHGAQIVRSPEPVHGRTSLIEHDERGVFAGLANPLLVCRYHSLMVEQSEWSSDWEVSARTADGIVMAIRHRRRPVAGVQFHPESILTDCGYSVISNFLRLADLVPRLPVDEVVLSEQERPDPARPELSFRQPVTF